MSDKHRNPHPNSPAGGGGPGGFRHAGPIGVNKQHGAGHTSESTQASIMNVRVSAESASQHSWTISPVPIQHPVTSVLSATTWDDLKHFAERVLGPTSFHVGVCYGLTEGLVSGIGSLLSLLKSLELEGVYELVDRKSVV